MPKQDRMVSLGDFLTDDEIKLACKLQTATLICEQITTPNIERINKALGQENDPKFLAFMVEYVVTRAEVL